MPLCETINRITRIDGKSNVLPFEILIKSENNRDNQASLIEIDSQSSKSDSLLEWIQWADRK